MMKKGATRKNRSFAAIGGGLALLLMIDPFGVASIPTYADQLQARSDGFDNAVTALGLSAPAAAVPLTGSWDPLTDADALVALAAELPDEDERMVVLDESVEGGAGPALLATEEEPPPGPAPVSIELGGLDVTVAQVPAESTPSAVLVRVAGEMETQDAGVTGVLLDVVDASSAPLADAEVQLTVSYSSFAGLVSGDWASRLQFVWMPDCTDSEVACVPQVIPTSNDAVAETVSAVVPVAEGESLSSAALPSSGTIQPSSLMSGSGGGGSLAITAGASGSAGDWGATSLSPSATWGNSGATGAFTWSLPLSAPAPAAGPAPQLALSYSSSASDGRTPSTNNQSGVVGEGFGITEGYVERSYVACADDEEGAASNVGRISGDLCWGTENATMMFNGSTIELIRDATTGEWHPEHEDGSKVEHITGSSWNSGEANEYWKVTTTDGIQYFFGRGKASASGPALNSAWTVPVYGNHPGDRCYTSSFSGSSCNQVWRWNLEYVVDPSGNSMTYFYDIETNRYVYDITGNLDAESASYVSGGHLNRIEYGTRAGQEASSSAPVKVSFSYLPRCITDLADADSFCSSAQTDTNANHWLDTPTDLVCVDATPGACATYSPAFFDRSRLAEVSTFALDGSTYRPLDSWVLAQTFEGEGAGLSLEYATNVLLVLKGVTHTGKAGTSSTADDITSPPFNFTYDFLANRIPSATVALPLLRPRIIGIRTDSGAQITVNYTTECGTGDVPGTSEPEQQANSRLCFPVKWSRNDGTDPVVEYFHKYVVDSIVESGAAPVASGSAELITGSLATVTSFDYSGGAAWAKPTGAMIEPSEVTYSEFRGMATVTTTVGEGTESSSSRVTYFRGMGGVLSAGPAGHQISVTDHEQFEGQVFSSVTLNGSLPTSEALTVPGSPVTVAESAAGRESTRIPSSSNYAFSFDAAGALVFRTGVTQTFNSYAQIVSVDDKGDLTTIADDTCSTVSYAHESDSVLAGKHILDRVSDSQVVAASCSTTPILPADLLAAEHKTYDDKGRLKRTERIDPTDGAGFVLSSEILSYDVRGRPLQVADAFGSVTSTTYGETPAGLSSSTTTTSPDPDGAGPLTGFQNTINLNPLTGQITSTVDPNGLVTTRSYDALGRLVSVVLPQHQGLSLPSVAHEYLVSPNGLNVVVTKSLGVDGASQQVSAAFYDGLLRQFQSQSSGLDAGQDHNDTAAERGRMVTHTYYDSAGRVIRTTGQWWAEGAVSTSPVMPIAVPPSTTTYSYDAAGRAVAEVFWVGTESNPINERWRTTTAYDGDSTLVVPPLGATPEATIVDARGRVIERVQYVRDPDEHAAADTAAEVLALEHNSTTYSYDAAGRLRELRDSENNLWSYDFDWGGRQVSSTDPDSGTTTKTYDLVDRVVTQTNANGETLAYTYDVLGRADTVRNDSVTGGIRMRWTYDTAPSQTGTPVLGQLATSTRYHEGQAYVSAVTRYDKAYRAIKTTFTLPNIPAYQALASRTFTNEYTFTVGGQVSAVSLPAIVSGAGVKALGAETVTTRYDAASMPAWMSGGFGWGTYVAESRFAADGRTLATDIGNTYGTYVSYGYEQGTNRLNGITLTRERLGVGLQLSYGYDAAGNVTSLKDQPTPSAASQDNQCFGYDGLRRLEVAWTAVDGNCAVAQDDLGTANIGGAEPYFTEYEYDDLGNRTAMVEHGLGSVPTKSTTYSVGAGSASPHQLVGFTELSGGVSTTTSFEYDEVGNRVEKTAGSASNSYSWDAEGELTADDDYEYIYDAGGNRIVREGAGGTTVYLPGGQELTISGSTVTAARYYSFGGRTIAMRTSNGLGGVTSFVSDRDGSVVASQPNTQWTVSSLARVYTDPFGGVRGNTDANVPGDKRFLGATRDEASGLSLLGARYYDADIGRFISVDPVLDVNVPAHLNGYSYGYNNPMTFSDPTGATPGKGYGKGPAKKAPPAPGGPVQGPAPEPDTAWSELAGCAEITCNMIWIRDFASAYYGGMAEVLGGLLYMGCGPCQAWTAVSGAITTFSDLDAHFARAAAAKEVFDEFWKDPWNNFWRPIGEDWANNPGHALGVTMTSAATALLPGPKFLPKGGGGTVGGATAALSTTERLAAHVQTQVARFEAGELVLSAKQAAASPSLQAAYRGQVIDAAVKRAVAQDDNLANLWISRSGEYGPDFHDIFTNQWWDITTPGQWQNHGKYSPLFGEGTGLFTR